MTLEARLRALICHATEAADGLDCRAKYGLESWCSACLAHEAADKLQAVYDLAVQETRQKIERLECDYAAELALLTVLKDQEIEKAVQEPRQQLDDAMTSRDGWIAVAKANATVATTLRVALNSIANSSCCTGCQEAALVARAALAASLQAGVPQIKSEEK